MLAIHKYPFRVTDTVDIKMPRVCKVLKVEKQRGQATGEACLWVLADLSVKPEMRYFRVLGTGFQFELGDVGDHIGTWQDGELVWHMFERL